MIANGHSCIALLWRLTTSANLASHSLFTQLTQIHSVSRFMQRRSALLPYARKLSEYPCPYPYSMRYPCASVCQMGTMTISHIWSVEPFWMRYPVARNIWAGHRDLFGTGRRRGDSFVHAPRLIASDLDRKSIARTYVCSWTCERTLVHLVNLQKLY